MTETPAPVANSFAASKRAAHVFLAELSTRIATRKLPYQHGVDARALESLVELFGVARSAIKDNPACVEFADKVSSALNLHLRPLTAKWHRRSVEGQLNSRDGSNEFRADLEAVREKLRALEKELREMAFGPNAPKLPEDEGDDFVARLKQELDGFDGAELKYGVPKRGVLAEEELDRIVDDLNRHEGAEIEARRAEHHLLKTTDAQQAIDVAKPGVNAVGLALSGGGIRSATFCLGVVQALADRNLLKWVDYLSTVSGGGYTGSFVTSRIGGWPQAMQPIASPQASTPPTAAGAQQPSPRNAFADVESSKGPDTDAIIYLRQHAKYLSAIELSERWRMVVETIAGLMLNWSAPLFSLGALALVAVNFTDHFKPEWWPWLAALAAALTIAAMLLFGFALRFESARAKRASTICALAMAMLCAACAAWALQFLFYPFFNLVHDIANGREPWTSLPFGWLGGTFSLAAISGAAPTVLRALPVLENPKYRDVVLKVSLAVAGLFVPFCALFVFYLFCAIGVAEPGDPRWWPLPRQVSLIIVTVFFGAVALTLNVNLTGLHRLYRNQLAKTFVQTQENEEAALPLESLNPSRLAPYHLINATVNLPSSAAAALRDRKCDFFLFSKNWCGSVATGYQPTSRWKANNAPVDLATAMAVSGAAISPRMGLGSIPSLSALMTFLNVRLNFWIRQPARCGAANGSPGFSLLLDEMFSRNMDEDADWLNLSDGGHIENMGVYELLRRRCKFIICVDGEADPDFAFPGLMTLVRHAQIDFGVRIDAKLGDIRPNPKTQCSRAHSGLFRVHYPAAGDRPKGEGLMLYFKLSCTGNESELIKRYRDAHNEFPHQSTLDQFFDQAQFEAYRQLGVHVGEEMFHPALVGDETTPASIARWFRLLADNLLDPAPSRPT